MDYVHHNYTNFTTDIDQCCDAMDYFSASDALLRLEASKVSYSTDSSELYAKIRTDGQSPVDIALLFPSLRQRHADELANARTEKQPEDPQARDLGS